MDSTTLSPDKIELSTVRKDEENDEVGTSACHCMSKVHCDTGFFEQIEHEHEYGLFEGR